MDGRNSAPPVWLRGDDNRSLLAETLGGHYLGDDQLRSSLAAAMDWLRSSDSGLAIDAVAGDEQSLVAYGGSCDRGEDVLRAAVTLVRERHGATCLAGRNIIWLGCRPHVARSLESEVITSLGRGAIVVCSDLTIDFPVFRNLLAPGGRRPPRPSRLDLGADAADIARLPFVPAVRLSAGHRPLTSDVHRRSGCKVVASDIHSGDPVVIVVPVLTGRVIYSTAHWLQSEPADTTWSGMRPLFATHGYRDIGERHPHVTVGEFHAVVAMLSTLTASIEYAVGARDIESTGDEVEARSEQAA